MRHLDFVLSPLDQFEVRDLFSLNANLRWLAKRACVVDEVFGISRAPLATEIRSAV